MMHIRALSLFVALLLPYAAWAQVCPAGSTCNPFETYVYGQAAASAPYGSGLRIPAAPNSTASSLQYIPANVLVTLGDTQTLTNKTLTAPTLTGATLNGTFAGAPTYTGTPIYSGLGAGTQVSCMGLDSGNHIVLAAAACGPGGSGTVTSVGLSVPAASLFGVSGSPVTASGTASSATFWRGDGTWATPAGSGNVSAGGTLTSNQIVLGAGTTAVATLGSLGTTSTLLHGNAAGAPTFSAVALASDVSGTLGVANGGTGLTSGTSGGVLAYTASGTLASSGALTAGKIMLGGGAGVAPTTDASAGLVLGALSLGASGTAGSVQMGNATSGTVTLQPATGALGSVTASLPANTGTIAELNLAQTWTAKQTFTAAGPIEAGANSGNVGSLKLYGNTSGDVTIKAAAIAGTATNFTLPATNGSNTNVLTTDGAGNTSWAAGGGGGGTITVSANGNTETSVSTVAFGTGFSVPGGSSGNAAVTLTNITNSQSGATYTLLTTDAEKSVWMTNGSATTVTVLAAATAGVGYATSVFCGAGCTLNRSASDTLNGATSIVLAANQMAYIQSDGISAYRIAVLPGVPIGTSGGTIPLLNGANTWSGAQSFNSGDLVLKGASTGTITLNAAGTAGTSTITLPGGTTDFSGTGGTSQFVKQASTGAAFTVARPVCADLSDSGAGCLNGAANPTATIGTTAVNGIASTYMRSDAAPAVPAASTSTAGIAKLYNVPLSIGWPAALDPNNTVIAVINQASTITAIVGAVESAVGATATVSVKKAPSGTSCSAGTTLHSGTFNANGTAATNQNLTVTVTTLAQGDRLCLTTTGGSNWTGGSGIGTISVFAAPS